ELARPDLWDDAEKARQITTERGQAADDIAVYESLSDRLEEAETLAELAREEGDDSIEPEITQLIATLFGEFDSLELRALSTGEYDDHDAVCEVHSGAGGTDAADWAEMLLRMYLRWAERKGFDVELDSATDGTGAGINSATFIVKGRNAYGMLRGEQ